MAIWQYTFEIIPRKSLVTIGVTDFLTDGDYEKYNFWENFDEGINFFISLVVEIGMNESWSEDVVIYGNEESTCIKIFLENDKITGVIVRIDIRYNYSLILNSIIQFCISNGLVILDDLKILDLDASIISQRIINSDQIAMYKKLFG